MDELARDSASTSAPASDSASELRLGDSLRNRHERPGVAAVGTSLLVHAGVFSLFFIGGMTFGREKVVYQPIAVHLVSPQPTVKGPPLPVETTSAVVATPKVETKAEPPKPAPKVKPQTQSTDSKVVSKPKDPKPAQGAKPKPGPVGGEGLNIVQEGIQFAYPEYSNNVIRRLVQFFRWDEKGSLTAQVEFYIRRDGSVGGVDVARSSGNIRFDLAAQAAVENAGRQKVFGPLPKGYQGDRLPITFTFAPEN